VEWNRLHQGDCIAALGRLEPGSVDLAFADPPFNIGYDYDVYDDKSDADKYLAWTRAWGQAVQRVLKSTGTFWLAIGDEYAAELKLIFQKELGFTCRSWVVWYYTFGVNCIKKFSRSHAHLFYFVRNARKYTFNNMAIRVPSARQLVYADSRADERGRLPDDTWILRPQDLTNGFEPDEDTWYFSRVCGTFKERAGWHGCQMPEQLLGRIIRACSNPGDSVLDPFGGSGTTLVVAKKLGRRWLGFELSPRYVARAQERLDAAWEGQPLEGAEEPRVSAPATPRERGRKAATTATADMTSRTTSEEIKRGIVEAFFMVRGTYPADRVIADPEVNNQFLEACRRLGLPGQPSEWNRRLFNLRKAGQFTGLPRSEKTLLSRAEIDRYSYACEIGLQHLKEQGQTLDRVLCDPEAAAEFDRYVRSMISEQVASFTIRWVALHLRKRAWRVRQAGRNVENSTRWVRRVTHVGELDCNALPCVPGLYWLSGQSTKLYVGQTLNLRQRFQLQFETQQFDFWDTERESLEVRYRMLPDARYDFLDGQQSWWIAHWQPVGNYLGFAAL
jgi:site-specific DNA-methyltransferase (adenine-specific)